MENNYETEIKILKSNLVENFEKLKLENFFSPLKNLILNSKLCNFIEE